MPVVPAVRRAFPRVELALPADRFHFLQENLRLLDRHEFVSVAVNDEHGRHTRLDVVDRRNTLAKLPLRLRLRRHVPKRAAEILQDSLAERALARLAVIQKVGRWKETRHRLDGAALPVHGVFGVGFSRAAARSEQE